MKDARHGRWARVARGFALAAASVFVASMSHVAAGGHGPGPLALLLTMAFSVVACTFIGGRTLTLPRLIAGVALSQVLLHLLFSIDADATGAEVISSHHGVVIRQLGATTAVPEADAAMWFAHAVAGAITIVLIRWGHVSFRALRRLARPFADALRRALVEPGSMGIESSTPSPSRDIESPRPPPWARSVSRRGPPLLSY